MSTDVVLAQVRVISFFNSFYILCARRAVCTADPQPNELEARAGQYGKKMS